MIQRVSQALKRAAMKKVRLYWEEYFPIRSIICVASFKFFPCAHRTLTIAFRTSVILCKKRARAFEAELMQALVFVKT